MKKLQVWVLRVLTAVMLCIVMQTTGAAPVSAGIVTGYGETMAGAAACSVGDTLTGSFGANDKLTRYYYFSIGQNSVLNISASTAQSSQHIAIFVENAQETSLAYLATADTVNRGYQNGFTRVSLTAGTYYLEVNTTGNRPSYQIGISLETASGGNIQVAGNGNANLVDAVPFVIGNELRGVARIRSGLQDVYPSHSYRFQLGSTQMVTFTGVAVDPDATGSLWMNLCDAWGNNIVSSYSKRYGRRNVYCNIQRLLPAGTYYITVSEPQSPLYYRIISAGADSRVGYVSAYSPSKKKMQVSWSTVSGADGYQIQYAMNKKFRSSRSASVAAGKSNYKKSGLKKGRKYYVRVRMYQVMNGQRVYGSWSKKCSVRISKW